MKKKNATKDAKNPSLTQMEKNVKGVQERR